MASTDVALANKALAIIGEALLTSALTENEKVNTLYSSVRDELLSMHPWGFALKRTRVTAAGLLDCSAKTITFVVNSGADTITDGGSGFVTNYFETGDIVSVEGSGSNNSDYKIASVAAGTLTLETFETVTAETLTNDTDLKLYVLTADGRYKYKRPSDCLRVYKVNETGIYNESTNWTVEGRFIVSDSIDSDDQLPIAYIAQITDPTLFDIAFEECFVLKLCAAFALSIKENAEQAKMWNTHFNYKFLQAAARNAWEGNPDTEREDTEWESAGR